MYSCANFEISDELAEEVEFAADDAHALAGEQLAGAQTGAERGRHRRAPFTGRIAPVPKRST